MSGVVLAARAILVAVFAVAGAAKLRDREGTALTLEEFGVPAALFAAAATLLPIAELADAALLLPDATAVAGAAGALVLLALFSAGIAVNLAAGRRPDCNCFGQIHSAPVGPSTLARNAILATLAVVVIADGRDGAAATALSRAGDLNAATALAAAALAVAVGAFALQTWVTLHLMRQNGTMLLRLDALDGGSGADARRFAPEPAGLPIGAPAPDFQLATASGEAARLGRLLGPGTLTLAFIDPACGPCRSLLPDLARQQRDAARPRLAIVISRADPEAVRDMLGDHEVPLVLLDTDGEVADAFHVAATPAAITIGPDGLVRSETVAGADAVRGMLERLDDDDEGFALSIVTVAGADPDGSSIGEPTPDLQLEDLDGEPVGLRAATADGSHLLLFWSPTCGYCSEMADAVHAIEASDTGPSLVVIASGDRAANREQGFRSLTLVDEAFAHSYAAFGVTGTPSALRLDARGRVVSHLAVGADRVLALAGASAPPHG